MDPIHIDFTIPNQSLYVGFGLLVVAITLYLAISKNWQWLKNRPNPLPWMAEHYVALLLPLGFIAISLAIYFWIWDIRGEIGRLVALLSGQTTPEDIRNLAYAIGALLAAVALSATIPFQLIKVWVNERLAKTTEQGHMTDRITKAVEQLGAEKTVWENGKQNTVPNLEVRLGAIYALERIAQDSMRDHTPVMKILCSYVRLNSPVTNKCKDVRADIQTILFVIGQQQLSRRRKGVLENPISSSNPYIYDLSDTNLKNADLSDADFSFINFRGTNISNAQLRGTVLISSNLNGAILEGTDLQDADLSWSNLNFTKLNTLSTFTNAIFDNTLTIGADFHGAHQLTKSQVETMFGLGSTKLPEHLNEIKMRKYPLNNLQEYRKWRAAKAAANL